MNAVSTAAACAVLLVGCATYAPMTEKLEISGSRIQPFRFEPVFNAWFNPTRAGTKSGLVSGIKTTAVFRIAPPVLHSALSSGEIPRGLQQLLDSEPTTEMTVAMTCFVCEDQAPRPQRLTYYRETRMSTTATWSFVPNKAKVIGSAGDISFTVNVGGVPYAFVSAHVDVRSANEHAEELPESTRTCAPDALPGGRPYDLVIWASDHNGQGRLAIEPIAPDLRVELESLVLDEVGRPRSFPIAATDWTQLSVQTRQTYIALKAVVEGETRPLPAGLPGIDAPGNYQLTEEDAKKARTLFYELGLTIHDRIVSGSSELFNAVKRVELLATQRKAQGKPIRLGIYTNGVDIPWQILHNKLPLGAIPDGEEHWGHKFILAATPILRLECLTLPSDAVAPSRSNILYMEYKSTAERDIVAQLSRMFADRLQGAFSQGQLKVASSPEAVQRVFEREARDLELIWTFTHGKNGIEFEFERGGFVQRFEKEGQRILLSDKEGDFVSAGQVLRWTTSTEFGPYLESRPIVFLNGCETGASGGAKGAGASFPYVFLERGARAVIATESPIWPYFGYALGTQYLANLKRGDRAAEALYLARLEFMQMNRNPFGLLYSIYGDGNARLIVR